MLFNGTAQDSKKEESAWKKAERKMKAEVLASTYNRLLEMGVNPTNGKPLRESPYTSA